MLLKKFAYIVFVIFLSGFVFEYHAQTSGVFTIGLDHPTKVINASGNSLLVAEGGTFTPNTGRISVVDKTTAVRHTLISGLPSGVSNLGGPPDTDGTTGLLLHGQVLYLTNGVGDAAMNDGPGIEIPNPAGPSSPIFNSILELTLPQGYTDLASEFVMTMANQTTLAGNLPVVLTNAEGMHLWIRLVVDLHDYRPEPRPARPDNVRAGHLFGLELFESNLYVVDAAFNVIHRVNVVNGNTTTLLTFPNRPNPLFPMLGGPFVEPVPDNIHRVGDRLLVPLLTGFPFIQNFSGVQSVDIRHGSTETLIPNLTSAIDVLRIENVKESLISAAINENSRGDGSYYTLEFSANQLANQPGRIRFYATPTATPVTVVPVVITPTSMVRDPLTGDIFVTNIFPGTLTRVQFP
ncbi:MAG: hypothetical protein ABIP78_08490 [Pyrinomonadaceae bacterium]